MPKFTRLEIALIIAIVLFICSCTHWVPGNKMKYHHFYKKTEQRKDTAAYTYLLTPKTTCYYAKDSIARN